MLLGHEVATIGAAAYTEEASITGPAPRLRLAATAVPMQGLSGGLLVAEDASGDSPCEVGACR